MSRPANAYWPWKLLSDQAWGPVGLLLHSRSNQASGGSGASRIHPRSGPFLGRAGPLARQITVILFVCWNLSMPNSYVADRGTTISEGIKKIDQIILLPLGESNAEPLVVKIHRVGQCRRGAIVKVRRTRRQPAQDGSLDLADVGALAGNQCTARIGHHKSLPRMWTLIALQGEDRQSRNIERRRTVGAGIGDADVQGRLDGMIAHVGRVVAGAAEPRDARQVEDIIETSDPGDVDLRGVEHFLAARHRHAILRFVAVGRHAEPRLIQVENIGVEGQAGGI